MTSATLYADQGKNLEKAEAMIRKAVTEEPDTSRISTAWAGSSSSEAKFEEARIPLEKAQADPRIDSTIPDHLGDVYFQLQLPAKAKEAWERALKLANHGQAVDKANPRDPQEARVAQAVRSVAQAEDGR